MPSRHLTAIGIGHKCIRYIKVAATLIHYINYFGQKDPRRNVSFVLICILPTIFVSFMEYNDEKLDTT